MYDILDFKKFNKTLNNHTFTDYYYRLMLLAMSVFEWENLPEGMDEKWIEKYLFNYGYCMFYDNPDMGLMVTKCTKDGLNAYDEPITLHPVATGLTDCNGYENGTEAILIRNNDVMLPTEFTIKLYAFRLAEITRTIDVNINAQKTPVIIKGTDKQMKSLKTAYEQVSDHRPVLFADKSMDMESFETFNVNAPVVFDKLEIEKHDIWNEVMTFLGINNSNQDKRERLVADEVSANNEQITSCVNVMLKSRELACEQINKLFKTNISVKVRSQEQLQELVQKAQIGSDGKGGEVND